MYHKLSITSVGEGGGGEGGLCNEREVMGLLLKFLKEPLSHTKILFCGCGLK